MVNILKLLREKYLPFLSGQRIYFYRKSREKIVKILLEPCRLLGSLLKTGLPLIGNVFKPIAKSVLIPLRLTAVKSATDATIHKKMFGSGATTLIISN